MTNRFEYTDSSGARLRFEPISERGERLVMLSAISPEHDLVVVDLDVNRVEEVIAGLRDMARQARGGAPEPSRVVVHIDNTPKVEEIIRYIARGGPGAAGMTQ